jgi:hypothetical protein
MTIAAYGRFTEAGIAKRAAQRAKAIETECEAVQPKRAPVAVPVAERVIVPATDTDALRMMKRNLMPFWARTIVMAAAEIHRVDPGDIIGRSRRRAIVLVRNEVWYRIKLTASPVTGEIPSYPTIGKWFGRDHSSIIYGAARHAFENGLPSPSNMDPEKLITRKKHRALEWTHRQRGAR